MNISRQRRFLNLGDAAGYFSIGLSTGLVDLLDDRLQKNNTQASLPNNEGKPCVYTVQGYIPACGSLLAENTTAKYVAAFF